MTHTKGKWEVLRNGRDHYIISDWKTPTCKILGKLKKSDVTIEEFEANAELIASAPKLKKQNAELLEALETIAILINHDTEYRTAEDRIRVIDMITSDAIAKAEGREG